MRVVWRNHNQVSVIFLCQLVLVWPSPFISAVKHGNTEDDLARSSPLGSISYSIENNLNILDVKPGLETGLLERSSAQVEPQIASVVQASTRMLEEPSLPRFIEEPRDQYIVKSKPVRLSCSVQFARETLFRCNGWWLSTPVSRTFEEKDPTSGTPYTRVTIDITRSNFDSFFGPYKYWCQCVAWSGAGQVKSRRATVELAYLRRNFQHEPVGGRAVVGSEYKLSCAPPKGLPKPTIEWLKNGEILDPSLHSNYLITQEGSLIIQARTITDSGNYTCLAKNLVTQRRSHTAVVRVGVNGQWSSWSSWSGCGTRCGIGEKRRLRTCTEPEPLNGGSPCRGKSIQTSVCSKSCPVNGGWTEWSRWSTCSPECLHRRRRTCTRPLPHNSGRVCLGADLETRNCSTGLCNANESQPSPSNHHLMLYGGLVAVVGLILLALIASIILRCKKRCSNSRRRRYNNECSTSFYSSAPHSGSFQSRDFGIVPAKLPMPGDPACFTLPPAYTTTENNYTCHGHVRGGTTDGQCYSFVGGISPVMNDRFPTDKSNFPHPPIGTAPRPTSREDQNIFYGAEYLPAEKYRLSQYIPYLWSKDAIYAEKQLPACPLYGRSFEKSEMHLTSANRSHDYYDSGFEGDSKQNAEECHLVDSRKNNVPSPPEDLSDANIFDPTNEKTEKRNHHIEKKDDKR